MRAQGRRSCVFQRIGRREGCAERTRKDARLPDVIWKVFGDPSNAWMVGVMLVGLVGVVAGPWAIIRAASRAPKPDPEG